MSDTHDTHSNLKIQSSINQGLFGAGIKSGQQDKKQARSFHSSAIRSNHLEIIVVQF